MPYNDFINRIINEEKIPGGLAKGKDPQDLANKHKVSIDKVKAKINQGTGVELEHTSDRETAREIAMDHIWEDLEYYAKLKEVEEMVAADAGVGSTAETGTGIAPQDDIDYAGDDSRKPTILGRRRKKKRDKIKIQRRSIYSGL